MIIYMCDKCKCELTKDSGKYEVTMDIMGFRYGGGRKYKAEYCERCLREVIGDEVVSKFLKSKEEQTKEIFEELKKGIEFK